LVYIDGFSTSGEINLILLTPARKRLRGTRVNPPYARKSTS
jgi:hypothetical protein